MLNVKLAGKSYPVATYRVTAEAIHKYARATNDANALVNSNQPLAPPAFPCVVGIDQLNQVMYDPDLGVDMAMLVHARQEHRLLVPIKAGDLLTVSTVLEAVNLADTGHTFTVATSLTNQDSVVAAEARSIMFIRRTNSVKAPAAPAERGEPVFEAPEEVADDQASRYADASGDHNPIHLDPAAAREAGFPGVILHGMCTMAFAAKAVVEHLAAGDPGRVRLISVEFARPVFPGQSLVTRAWPIGNSATSDGVDEYGFETVNARGSAVLKGGRVELVHSG
ncbi:MAG TPA: MaoC/PaaZ C-terminal domain-containing protein [Actinomycetota bacterium]|nr:MaoC/PaaZ C-terminal domain-containing protein [Actinomycetota bacterium]